MMRIRFKFRTLALNMWWLFVCVTLVACVHGKDTSVTVTSPVGTIRGYTSGGHEQFVQFLGVPYGVVDEEDPFGPAKPYPPFVTPFSAYNDPPACTQVPDTGKDDGVPEGSIHCLNLNIYTPDNATPNSNYPVMFYVHGGSYVEGNGNIGTYSPTFLVRNNVILVTVNYRLGPYGFLCLPELGYSNQGLKDIILALKWVKDNIKSFGGDEENILLFGNSSGSHAVEAILLYNDDNVFNKTILQSGHVVSPYFFLPPADHSYIVKLAERLDINAGALNTQDIMKHLSNVDRDLLINATRYDKFSPCVDDTFIKIAPKKSNFNGMKIMIGTMPKEIVCFFVGKKGSYLNIVKDIVKTGFVNISEEAIDKVTDFYYPVEVRDNAADVGSDFVFNYPAERSIRYYLANNAEVYRYVFSYDGGRNFVKTKFNISDVGATHADELGYLFDMDMFKDVITTEDNNIINIMSTLWTNFAKYGNPTPAVSDVISVLWPQFDENTKRYMLIDSSLSVQEDLHRDRINFWDKFYEQYGKYSRGFHLGEDFVQSLFNVFGLSLTEFVFFMVVIVKLYY